MVLRVEPVRAGRVDGFTTAMNTWQPSRTMATTTAGAETTIARLATGRQAVIAFEAAFHGRTMLAMTFEYVPPVMP